jgi:hypothetical protein
VIHTRDGQRRNQHALAIRVNRKWIRRNVRQRSVPARGYRCQRPTSRRSIDRQARTWVRAYPSRVRSAQILPRRQPPHEAPSARTRRTRPVSGPWSLFWIWHTGC